MAGQRRVADPHVADAGKGRLEGGQQLGFELAVDLAALITSLYIAADIGIEQQRVGDSVGILTKTANRDVDINARPLIHDAEGNRRGRAVLVADQFLGVEVVDPLILGGLAAKGETLADGLEHLADALAQVAGKNTGFRGHVVCILARLSAHVHHLALLHNEHTLAVRHRDDGTVGDDVIAAFCVAGTARGTFLSLYRQHIGGDCLTVEVFLPLVGQHAARTAQCRFNKSHNRIILSLNCKSRLLLMVLLYLFRLFCTLPVAGSLFCKMKK